MKVTAYVSHPDCPRHDPGWNHPDHQGRLPAITRAVHRDMVALWEPLLQVEAVPATEADLRLVHTQRHIAEVQATAMIADAQGKILELDGVPVSGASWDAAIAAAGSAVTAVETVLSGAARNAFAAARPPGRGARPDAAGELSLFNHVAVAARHLRERRGSSRVLVVSWGARPADVLRQALGADPAVAVLSLHQAPDEPPNPLRAEPSRGDVALPAGSGGAAYGAAQREALDAVPAVESPDFVLLSAGFDLLAGDPLGGLAVTPAEVHALTAELREWAEERCGGRLVSVLEGGYAANETARAVIQHLRALAGLPKA